MTTNKINSLLEQLVAISTDLKAMLAVHDERLNKQEKETDDLQTKVERRREELDTKDRKSTRLNSSHTDISRMPSSA